MSVSAYVQRITLNASSCITNSGGRIKHLDIIAGFFCCVTGFTSDFLSFIVVEHIRFFHGALQLWKHARNKLLTIHTTINVTYLHSCNKCSNSGITR